MVQPLSCDPCCDAYFHIVNMVYANIEIGMVKLLNSGIRSALTYVAKQLLANQTNIDFEPNEESMLPDDHPTPACTKAISCLREIYTTAREMHEDSALLSISEQLAVGVHRMLLQHILQFTFNTMGGLRLKRDLTEYSEAVTSFLTCKQNPSLEAKFKSLCSLPNIFIVPPERRIFTPYLPNSKGMVCVMAMRSLPGLIDGNSQIAREEFLRYMTRRADYQSSKLASFFPEHPPA
eukprot:8684690-Pyramimonas_sp.AAC.1